MIRENPCAAKRHYISKRLAESMPAIEAMTINAKRHTRQPTNFMRYIRGLES